jgi:hypothetical protein
MTLKLSTVVYTLNTWSFLLVEGDSDSHGGIVQRLTMEEQPAGYDGVKTAIRIGQTNITFI